MGQIADALRALINNSEDLSSLPQLVARVEEIENSEQTYQQRIADLQDINRKYLAQIPIPNQEPNQDETPEEPTFEDAKSYLEQALKGDK